MSDRKNDAYMDIMALLVAAVILLIMISITEAAASHKPVVANLDDASACSPQTERIGSPIRRDGSPTSPSGLTFTAFRSYLPKEKIGTS